jgi:phosphohistidine phosphatase
MKVYIMRHGPAEDRAESGRDFDRALTASGRDRVRDVARELRAQDEAPSAIYTSPLVRAVQTAEIVAIKTELSRVDGTVETRTELSPGGRGHDLILALAKHQQKRVMLVGHEPDLTQLVAEMVGESVSPGFDKAMVVGLHVESSDGAVRARLRFILDPKTLKWSRSS